MDAEAVDIQFPPKLLVLFSPKRYKVAYGGRGGAKSWGFARALLMLGGRRCIRVLCTREVQKSIKDSVHSLLKDQIGNLGLGSFYSVLETEIRGENGTQFLFSGLSTQTVESIKSYEGIDICWVEEARTVSKRSWSILTPTIRKDGSEIWVSFNPELDDDETYVRFVVNPPPDSVVVKIGYQDNPWFPEVLEKERAHAQRTLPKDEYENIWEGNCKAAAEGAIYATEIREAIEHGRVCPVVYDPKLKVHAVADIGWNDATHIILVQRHLSTLRLLDSIEDDHKTFDWWSAELRNKRLNWGKLWLPHDAWHTTPESGRNPATIFRDLGWAVDKIPNQPIETGIKMARMGFAQCFFDKVKADRLIQCLKRYRRNIPTTTNEPSSPVHDEYSHGADAFRYLHLVAPRLGNEALKPIQYSDKGVI